MSETLRITKLIPPSHGNQGNTEEFFLSALQMATRLMPSQHGGLAGHIFAEKFLLTHMSADIATIEYNDENEPTRFNPPLSKSDPPVPTKLDAADFANPAKIAAHKIAQEERKQFMEAQMRMSEALSAALPEDVKVRVANEKAYSALSNREIIERLSAEFNTVTPAQIEALLASTRQRCETMHSINEHTARMLRAFRLLKEAGYSTNKYQQFSAYIETIKHITEFGLYIDRYKMDHPNHKEQTIKGISTILKTYYANYAPAPTTDKSGYAAVATTSVQGTTEASKPLVEQLLTALMAAGINLDTSKQQGQRQQHPKANNTTYWCYTHGHFGPKPNGKPCRITPHLSSQCTKKNEQHKAFNAENGGKEPTKSTEGANHN